MCQIPPSYRNTTDGSEPSELDTLYTGPITTSESKTFRFKGRKGGYEDSPILNLDIDIKLSDPSIVANDSYIASGLVEMVSEYDVYYTTDGTDPDENSNLYTGPITIEENTTIKAIAYKAGCINSDVVEKYISIICESPMVDTEPYAVVDTVVANINFTNTLVDENLYYTIDGSDPKTDGILWDGNDIVSDDSFVLKAYIRKSGCEDSAVVVWDYILKTDIQVYLQDDKTSYNVGESIVLNISTTESDHVLYYTIDGNDPIIEVSDVWDGTLTMPDVSCFELRVVAISVGHSSSDIFIFSITKNTPPVNIYLFGNNNSYYGTSFKFDETTIVEMEHYTDLEYKSHLDSEVAGDNIFIFKYSHVVEDYINEIIEFDKVTETHASLSGHFALDQKRSGTKSKYLDNHYIYSFGGVHLQHKNLDNPGTYIRDDAIRFNVIGKYFGSYSKTLSEKKYGHHVGKRMNIATIVSTSYAVPKDGVLGLTETKTNYAGDAIIHTSSNIETFNSITDTLELKTNQNIDSYFYKNSYTSGYSGSEEKFIGATWSTLVSVSIRIQASSPDFQSSDKLYALANSYVWNNWSSRDCTALGVTIMEYDIYNDIGANSIIFEGILPSNQTYISPVYITSCCGASSNLYGYIFGGSNSVQISDFEFSTKTVSLISETLNRAVGRTSVGL